jgi:RNA polymerase primary sigma factor
MVPVGEVGTSETTDDLTLVRAVLARDAHATESFLRRIGDVVWRVCRLLTGDEAAARDAFTQVLAGLRADQFARLRNYDGRSRLETYITAAARDLLAQRVLRLLRTEPRKGWIAFEKLYANDIRRVILRRLPGQQYEETRKDAYQEICAAFVADDYRRLSSFNGTGSFSGFVLHAADRLLIDFIRTFRSRRRMPAAIARLSALDQAVFRLVYWHEKPTDARQLADALHGFDPIPGTDEVAASLARLHALLPQGYAPVSQATRVTSLTDADAEQADRDGLSPEESLIVQDDERRIAAAAEALKAVAAELPEADRIYIRIVLSSTEPLPARDIAKLMERPVAEVYKLKQRVLKQLKAELEGRDAVKNWLASV